MRKINPKEFSCFIIYGKGWSVSLYDFDLAIKKWREIPGNGEHSFIGTKLDGSTAILDTK